MPNEMLTSNKHIDLGQFGYIDWDERPGKYLVWVNLTPQALKVLSEVFNIKAALEVNELQVKDIQGDTIRTYIETQAEKCGGVWNGEVIAKFMLKTSLNYENGKLEAQNEIYNYDSSSSGRCVLVGGALYTWRLWFTKHFYDTINSKIPNIVQEIDLPIDQIVVTDGKLRLYSEVPNKALVDKIIETTKRYLRQGLELQNHSLYFSFNSKPSSMSETADLQPSLIKQRARL